MSLENINFMKLNPWDTDENRWGWIRLGNGTSAESRRVKESKNNRYHISNYHHGGVNGVRMWRSVIETKREIPTQAPELRREVGEVHSSDDSPVMGGGVKEPYLVAVNREAKEM